MTSAMAPNVILSSSGGGGGGSKAGSAATSASAAASAASDVGLERDSNEYSELLSHEQNMSVHPVSLETGRSRLHSPMALFGGGGGENPDQSPTSPPPLPLKIGSMGQKNGQQQMASRNGKFGGAGNINGIRKGEGIGFHHPLQPPNLCQPNTTNGGPSSDWIELSTSLSREFNSKRGDILSNNSNKSAIINNSSPAGGSVSRRKTGSDSHHHNHHHNLIMGSMGGCPKDEAVQPLLPKESLDSPTPPPMTSTTTSVTTATSSCMETSSSTSSQATTATISSSTKGPAPQPPTRSQSPVIIKQPQKSTSVSRGLQVETDDLIQFSSGNPKPGGGPESNNNLHNHHPKILSSETKAANAKHQLRSSSRDHFELDVADDDGIVDDDDDDDLESARTADEQMDYLEGLESCPCYAKCCIDSIITLFCVTLLG